MFNTFFILITYAVIIIVALVIRKKKQLPWSIFFLFNIAVSIGYIVLSLTLLEDIMHLPFLQANMEDYLEQKEHLSVLIICLLGLTNVLISLGLFIFFIFRDIEEC